MPTFTICNHVIVNAAGGLPAVMRFSENLTHLQHLEPHELPAFVWGVTGTSSSPAAARAADVKANKCPQGFIPLCLRAELNVPCIFNHQLTEDDVLKSGVLRLPTCSKEYRGELRDVLLLEIANHVSHRELLKISDLSLNELTSRYPQHVPVLFYAHEINTIVFQAKLAETGATVNVGMCKRETAARLANSFQVKYLEEAIQLTL